MSTVQGELSADQTAVDALTALFPPGSMTGAPKKRALEVLHGIEKGPRGAYSGVFGYFAANGVADLATTIRTIVITDEGTSFGTGGGITCGSVPADEVNEMLLKARALLSSIYSAQPDADAARQMLLSVLT